MASSPKNQGARRYCSLTNQKRAFRKDSHSMTDDFPCESCGKLPIDVLDILQDLMVKKRARWRGTIKLHLDGSGIIVSIAAESVRKTRLTLNHRLP